MMKANASGSRAPGAATDAGPFPDQLEEVARTLDISRATLYRLLDKHDLL